MNLLDELSYLQWLKEQGYKDPQPLSGNRYAAIMPMMFTHGIIVGKIGDIGYDDRWCYHNYTSAKAALEAWDGTGEPKGWHRHPRTGRRRSEDGEEYVNF